MFPFVTLSSLSNFYTVSVAVKLGLDIPSWQLPLHCPVAMEDNPHSNPNPHAKDCLWKYKAEVKLKYIPGDEVQCYNVVWQSFTHKVSQ